MNQMRLSFIVLVVPLLVLIACKKEQSSPVVVADVGPAASISISYPLPGTVDLFNLRHCPLSDDYEEMTCRMIGTKGPVRKISWMDEDLHVLETSIEFDRSGNVTEICRRGHVDFQGMTCAKGPFPGLGTDANVVLDGKGRLISRPHSSLEKDRIDTCIYDDLSVPKRSECRDGEYVYVYTYDDNGRTLSYSRRLIPTNGEAGDRMKYLDKEYALDLAYSYRDDRFGNWIEFETRQAGESRGQPVANTVNHRILEYY